MISRSASYQIFNKFVFSPDQKTLTSLFTFLTSQKHVLFCSDSSVFSNQLNSRNIYSIEIRKPTPFIHVSLFSNITNDNFEDSCRYTVHIRRSKRFFLSHNNTGHHNYSVSENNQIVKNSIFFTLLKPSLMF